MGWLIRRGVIAGSASSVLNGDPKLQVSTSRETLKLAEAEGVIGGIFTILFMTVGIGANCISRSPAMTGQIEQDKFSAKSDSGCQIRPQLLSLIRST